jgi:hypothetical protein
MLDREREELDLAQADLDVMAARERIARLEQALEAMAERGQDTAVGERILRTMRETLAAFVGHRDAIRQTIEAIDKGLL